MKQVSAPDLQQLTCDTLIVYIGGIKSGKSKAAESHAVRLLAERAPQVDERVQCVVFGNTKLAKTDKELAARIEVHRASRPASLETIEAYAIPRWFDELDANRIVLIDGLSSALCAWMDAAQVSSDDDFHQCVDEFCSWLSARQAPTVVVTDEVGFSLVATTAVGRRFVDELGVLNQRVVALADQAILVVAGKCLTLS